MPRSGKGKRETDMEIIQVMMQLGGLDIGVLTALVLCCLKAHFKR